jgi:5S rRNA maturation endonuclease (ribonuclease M5)
MPPNNQNRFRSAKIDPYLDQGRLLALQTMLCARMDELLTQLDIDVLHGRKVHTGCCPIHGGNNPNALNIYPKGDDVPGYWVCNTHRCHNVFKRTVLGLIRGVLSNQRYGWRDLADTDAKGRQRMATWRETVDWACQLLDTTITSIEVNYAELEKRGFASQVAQLTRMPGGDKPLLARSDVRKWLQIPAAYFVRRGWSPEILDRYDVGLYPVPGKPLSNRVAVPVYDDEHRGVVGFTGRSIHEQCSKCKRWHAAGAACASRDHPEQFGRTAKWYNHGLSCESYLYNLWFAKSRIRDSGIVVLVEGPGDVWRLEEAGIHNAVGLFGASLSDRQQVAIEMSGAMHIVVLSDMDQAGDSVREQVRSRLGKLFRLHFPLLSTHDIGDMSVGQVKQEVIPVLEAISRRV